MVLTKIRIIVGNVLANFELKSVNTKPIHSHITAHMSGWSPARGRLSMNCETGELCNQRFEWKVVTLGG